MLARVFGVMAVLMIGGAIIQAPIIGISGILAASRWLVWAGKRSGKRSGHHLGPGFSMIEQNLR